MYASFKNNIEIVKILLNAGANIAIKDSLGGDSLMYASNGKIYTILIKFLCLNYIFK